MTGHVSSFDKLAADVTRTVTGPSGTTHFFTVYGAEPIILKKGPPIIALPAPKIGTAMVFVPRAVNNIENAPMLVYYHGHNGSSSVETYIGAMQDRDFRPLLYATNMLLVEPWGGTLSKFGILGTSAGLSLLIKQAMSTALQHSPRARPQVGPTPMPSSLVLAGFSGGGATLMKVVMGVKADYVGRLKEVWCFDCMYSGEGQKWYDWATQNPQKTLRVRVASGEGTGSPRAQAVVIRNAMKRSYQNNIDIEDTTQAGHEQLPGLFIPGWI